MVVFSILIRAQVCKELAFVDEWFDHNAVWNFDRTPWPDDSVALRVEAKAGTLVIFHGLLPHYSAPNRSPVSRHAYTLHVTDGRTTYSPQNWIQRDTSFPVRGFMP